MNWVWRAVVLAGVLALALRGGTEKKPADGPSNAERAPDFELTSLDGETVKLSDYRGKPVLLTFWAYQ